MAKRGKQGRRNRGEKHQHRVGLSARLRGYFLTGILVAAPISITLFLTWQLLGFVDARITPFIPAAYNPNTYLPFAVPGLGLIVLIVFITFVGALTTLFVGRTLLAISDSLLHRMPVVRSIYGATKQIFETILAQKSTAFRQVVMFEYPRRGCWAMGFVTGVTKGEIQNLTEEEMVNVFLPTTPNPTSGYLLFLPRRELVPLKMSVEEGAKMIISGGIVAPPDPRQEEERKIPKIPGPKPAVSRADRQPEKLAGE